MEDATTKLYQRGHGSLEEAYEAKLLLLKAELEYAEKESDCLTIYTNFVDVSKQFENRAEERMKTGRGMMVPARKFKARRLEVKINLERAKAKQAK